ncbi:hypothetical protein EVAR_41198_1 [Eumeta japonica]|uniref:Uncharacterized protein n=1 Tax=Eumeta variegata TaxID=151549 RepID=A0A4C1WPZ9_EUMVA|nr:hypothetical protein EVAR_41198_1 [Eumeta japonica]
MPSPSADTASPRHPPPGPGAAAGSFTAAKLKHLYAKRVLDFLLNKSTPEAPPAPRAPRPARPRDRREKDNEMSVDRDFWIWLRRRKMIKMFPTLERRLAVFRFVKLISILLGSNCGVETRS